MEGSSWNVQLECPIRRCSFEGAVLRAQFEGAVWSVAPASALTLIDSHFFRVLLFRRFHLRLPHSSVRCRCGRPFDPYGYQRARGRGSFEDGRLQWKAQEFEFAGRQEDEWLST